MEADKKAGDGQLMDMNGNLYGPLPHEMPGQEELPAFAFHGLPRRAYLAAAAMQGILASGRGEGLSAHDVAAAAVDYADALLARLGRK